jgi:hypothetical protein
MLPGRIHAFRVEWWGGPCERASFHTYETQKNVVSLTHLSSSFPHLPHPFLNRILLCLSWPSLHFAQAQSRARPSKSLDMVSQCYSVFTVLTQTVAGVRNSKAVYSKVGADAIQGLLRGTPPPLLITEIRKNPGFTAVCKRKQIIRSVRQMERHNLLCKGDVQWYWWGLGSQCAVQCCVFSNMVVIKIGFKFCYIMRSSFQKTGVRFRVTICSAMLSFWVFCRYPNMVVMKIGFKFCYIVWSSFFLSFFFCEWCKQCGQTIENLMKFMKSLSL